MNASEVYNYLALVGTGGLGACMCVGDALLAAPILYHEALRVRKEFLSIAALAVADAVNGLAFFIAGFSGLIWMMVDPSIEEENTYGFTRFDCLLHPHNLIWTFVFCTSGTLLPVLSMDRLLYAIAPMWYAAKGPGIAQAMILAMYAHGFALGLVTCAHIAMNNSVVPRAICLQWDMMGQMVYGYQMAVFILGHLLSIVIFVWAFLLYVRHNRKTVSGGKQLSASVQSQQRSLMLNVAGSTLATFLLVILPLCLDLIFGDQVKPVALRPLLFYIINYVNPLINVYLFLINNRLMRRALQLMFEGKQGPHNLSTWVHQKPSIVSVKMVEVNCKPEK